MAFRKTIALVLVNFALTLAGFAPPISTPEAVAQDRRSERDDDDRDSDDRRERSRRWRDRSGDDDDRDGDENRADSKASEKASSNDDISLTTKSWATTFVQQHDKNKNSWLDGDELRSAGRRAEAADSDHDKVVTIDELVASTMKSASTSSSSAAAAPAAATSKSSDDDDNKSEDRDRGSFFGFSRDRGRDSEGERSGDESKSGTAKRIYTGTVGVGKAGKEEKSARRTYRFAPAGERLPTGLPSWFESRDKNGDGQVLMSEYSRSWSSRMVAEFRRHDANDDGVITAKEVAKK
jgi:hypothetical protein